MKTVYLIQFIVLMSIQILLLFNLSVYAESSLNAPEWLKEGVYAKYTFEKNFLLFRNGTTYEGDHGFYMWDCVELNETTAKLRVNLSSTKENKHVQITANVYVNPNTRSVILENGSLIGTTNLWLPVCPTENDNIIMWDLPPDRVSCKIKDGLFRYRTPQGFQEAFLIDEIGQMYGVNRSFFVYCDYDTGIMIDGGLMDEVTVDALGIIEFGLNGRFIFDDTNIDLGPSMTTLEQQSATRFDLIWIFGLAPLIIFFIVFFIVHKSRKKKGVFVKKL